MYVDETKKTGFRIVGNVDFDEAQVKASCITLPKGVGPMTVAMLMRNTVLAAGKAADKLYSSQWKLALLRLNLLEPVPK